MCGSLYQLGSLIVFSGLKGCFAKCLRTLSCGQPGQAPAAGSLTWQLPTATKEIGVPRFLRPGRGGARTSPPGHCSDLLTVGEVHGINGKGERKVASFLEG